MKRIIFTISSVFFVILSGSRDSLANNLRISNVSLEDRNITNNTAVVEFDIDWDNSWRDTTNYDAVWVVLKVSKNGSAELTHAQMDACGVDPAGTSSGSNSDLVIDVPCNDKNQTSNAIYNGAFLYRLANGTGTMSSENVRLVIDYAQSPLSAADTDTLAVTVIGIEMVYIPEGPFYAGDGAATATFRQRTPTGERDPWYIQSENQILTTNGTSGSFYYTATGSEGAGLFASGAIFTLYVDYPKGYAAFYCMKYSITEGQWETFINSLADGGKDNRDITGVSGKNSDNVIKRNTVSYSAATISISRADRALSYISWMDLAAYLDWVALRPMTELEYEKVARGKLDAVPHEYAWGDSSIIAGTTFSISPEDGTETISGESPPNANYNLTTFSQGDDFLGAEHAQGPVRVGIFAKSSSTRSQAGGGYYGVMELSGNLIEHVVTVGSTSGTIFFGVNGDGILNVNSLNVGFADQLGWVGTHLTEGADGVTHATGTGLRGGSWNQTAGALEISDRSEASTISTAKTNRFGGRGVRSVSPPSYPDCGNAVIEPPEQCDEDDVGSCSFCVATYCYCTEAGP